MRYLVTLILSLFILITSSYAVPIQVEIYTIPNCPGCEIAKATLNSHGITPTEISLYGRRDLYKQMKERVYAALPPSERRPMEESMTVPKIFINGQYVPHSELDDRLDKLTAQNNAVGNTNTARHTDKNEDS